MQQPIVIRGAASGCEPCPIIPEWVLAGQPVARARSVMMSIDKTLHVMAWDCTPGQFEWHYGPDDEIVYFLAGEVFISMAGAMEQRLSAGDVAMFPAGCRCTWRVTQPVRKLAVLRKPLPSPMGLVVRAWHKLVKPARKGGLPAPRRA